MLDIFDYTSCEDIRAVLGVDALELPDETLGLPIYGNSVLIRLSGMTGSLGGVSGSVVTIYNSIKSKPVKTDNELYFIALVNQFITYLVAEACCSGLSMFALKSQSDGKASQTRFSAESAYKDIIGTIREKLASLTGLLEEMMSEDYAYVGDKFSVVKPAVDRVTGT